MSNTVQAVVIGDNVYVGGGNTRSDETSGTVMVYSLDTGSWRTLPPYESQWFGMAVANNQLVLVGGNTISLDEETGVLAMWDEGSQTWTHPFPDMPTSRHSSSVVSYQKWLVVAGGYMHDDHLIKVEVLDTLSGKWYEGSPLPNKRSEMTSTICRNMWYLSGGFSSRQRNKYVVSVCLDELISQAVSQSAGTTSPSTPSPWQTLTVSPLTYSTLFVLKGALLTVGGDNSSAIHHYQPSSRSWVKVGDLPTKRWQCACTVLPNGEIFVAGGGTAVGMFDRLERVDFGVLI